MYIYIKRKRGLFYRDTFTPSYVLSIETLLQRPTIFQMSQKGLAGRNDAIVGLLPWSRSGPKILMGTEKKTYDILKTNS